MLTDRELQSLRNLGNEAEDAADLIERLMQYVMQQDMRIADLERELHTLKMAAEGDEEAFAAVVEHKRKAESECQRLQRLLDAAHKIIGELARPSGI